LFKKPTLSVILCNYNHAQFLPEALQGIADQTYQPMEFIVLDDASTDSSIEVIKEFALKYPLIRVIRNEKNMGPLYNANRLLKLASGEYIYFGAADDKVLPGFFEKSMDLLTRYPYAGICSSLSLMIDLKGNLKVTNTAIISKMACYLTPQECANVLNRHGPWMFGNTTIYRRQPMLEVGGFNADLGPYADCFLTVLLSLRYGACFIPEILGSIRYLESGYSNSEMSNFKKFFETFQHAKTLKRLTYSKIFPLPYIDKWERRSLYKIGLSAWAPVIRENNIFFSNSLNIFRSNQSYLDKIFHILISTLAKIQTFIVKCYFIGAFRPPLLEYMRNRLTHRGLCRKNNGK
jgi:glycosyltransferase involved in cell wall biosynthesis